MFQCVRDRKFAPWSFNYNCTYDTPLIGWASHPPLNLAIANVDCTPVYALSARVTMYTIMWPWRSIYFPWSELESPNSSSAGCRTLLYNSPLHISYRLLVLEYWCITYVLLMCDVYTTYVWHICYLCVAYILLMCDVYTTSVWHIYYFCVAYILLMCDAGTTCVLQVCYTPPCGGVHWIPEPATLGEGVPCWLVPWLPGHGQSTPR